MSKEVDDLFARAMIGLDDEEGRAWEDGTGWAAIARLHGLGSQAVLDAALAACHDADPLRRRIGAAVLGQLGHSVIGFEPVFVEQRYHGLAELLTAECAGPQNIEVMSDVCVAFGHLGDPRAIPALLELRNHPEASVRFGVALGLSGHSLPDAIDGLIALSSDTEESVRDWSTFGLAQMTDADTPTIRAALHARLDDPCVEARNEAIEGLASRGDRSVLPVLIRELKNGVSQPLLDAAITLACPELCEALIAAKAGGLVVQAFHGPYDLAPVWKEAMRACGCPEC